MVARLEKTAAEHGSTMFLVLLSAVAEFARRRTGRRRQVITVQTAEIGVMHQLLSQLPPQ